MGRILRLFCFEFLKKVITGLYFIKLLIYKKWYNQSGILLVNFLTCFLMRMVRNFPLLYA
ncbi:hypothetical protein HWHPT5561_02960 [Petrotoga sp. HWH.PT.55.6.1]|uniref:Uncharacterized protein n=1 Tax=Petrotoga sibirica DSM 13575 TaxID=1122956 RepID=A0A855MP88_9BACT|nr:hypothetical protein X926_05325 [Petrotoga sp. HWHPT.55.6.3]POZ89324.1 hypothetical protein AA80_01485 [Petrotoga sibirica DSM 13575]RPD36107.1 hypothetical protein HWHPT5561_02960 [Petrotoga sp. HWH.PT.55.6.1]